jgi:hypothetical protein
VYEGALSGNAAKGFSILTPFERKTGFRSIKRQISTLFAFQKFAAKQHWFFLVNIGILTVKEIELSALPSWVQFASRKNEPSFDP